MTPGTDWDAVAAERRSDLLVDLALLNLNRRPTFTGLPEDTPRTFEGWSGHTSRHHRSRPSAVLSRRPAGDPLTPPDASTVGKRLPGALYAHKSALQDLPPVLRVYEGCARWLVGEVDGANLVKLATDRPKISYLEYPGFDRDPHPVLRRTTYVRIGALDVDERDYSQSDNPPILHRKECFVGGDYPCATSSPDSQRRRNGSGSSAGTHATSATCAAGNNASRLAMSHCAGTGSCAVRGDRPGC